MANSNTGANVRIEVHLNGVDRQMMNLARQLGDFKDPLRDSGTQMEASIGRRFRSGGGTQQWRALAQSTIDRHPHRAGGKPLNDTGRLKMSATAGASQRITSERLAYSWGSGVPYAGVHNFGYRSIPQRQFLYFDQKDERAIKRIFEDYIKGLIP